MQHLAQETILQTGQETCLLQYKGGAKDDNDNYRGISTSSCLSKLYSTVLYLRVLEVNEMINKEACLKATEHMIISF